MSWTPIPDGSPFPLSNLPFGIGHDGEGQWRAWVAIGDDALDLAATAAAGAFDGSGLPPGAFGEASLNRYLAAGRDVWRAVRERLMWIVSDAGHGEALGDYVTSQSSLTMTIPVAVGDYVDFYSSLHHATNLGRLFRPDGDPLMPNWRRIPIGYHGRSGTFVADGATVVRPIGHRLVDGDLEVGPTRSLDIELEVGTVIGAGSEIGQPIPIEDAAEHLYGMCLVNDWSARDIQAYEYQPLGPFLGKSFATSMSPWLVSFEALEPFRVASPPQEPSVANYLSTIDAWGFDLHLEVWFESAQMRSDGTPPVRLSKNNFSDMYWTPAQQLAHMTVNGANCRAGDVFASGTVSGPEHGTEGSLIELTWRGERPLTLPDGTSRSFLEDGDRVEMCGWAGSDPETRIGLGSVSGTIGATIDPGSL
jgi:fumarylacetoacetase